MQFLQQRDVIVREFHGILEAPITPVLFLRPGVSLDRQTESAKFAKHHCAIRHGGRRAWSGILMMIEDVAGREMIPAAGAIDKPGWIELLRQIQNPNRIELSPAFVERHPNDD